MYGETEKGGQRSSQAGSPNKGYWHEGVNVYFNSEYLESFSLARTKEMPPFPQDHRWMSKLIWSCLNWWHLNTSCFQPVCSGKSGSWWYLWIQTRITQSEWTRCGCFWQHHQRLMFVFTQSRCAITGPKSVTFFHLSSLSLIRIPTRAFKGSASVHPHSFSLICGYIAAKQSIATWARPYCTQLTALALQIGSILFTMVSWDFGGLSLLLFKAFYWFFIMCMCVCLCKSVNAWVQKHAEAAGVRFPLGRSYRNFWTAQHGC